MLNLQVAHMSDTNLSSLGHWLFRRMLRAVTRLEDAKNSLAECDMPLEVLRESWQEQVKAQSRPLSGMDSLLYQGDLDSDDNGVKSKWHQRTWLVLL